VNDYSLENLESNPTFNFSNSLLNSDFFPPAPHGFSDDVYDDSPYSDLNIQCNYMDVNNFTANFKNQDKFSFLSLNVQSLHAKFSALEDFIINLQSNNCAPDIILLQELWQIQDVNAVCLENYDDLIFKCRTNNVQGGGWDCTVARVLDTRSYKKNQSL
jgi:hypothetical protein